MPVRLEITLRPELFDAEGETIRLKARDYFNIHLDGVRTIHVLTIDAQLAHEQLELARHRIFTNPVSQVSSFKPWPLPLIGQYGLDSVLACETTLGAPR